MGSEWLPMRVLAMISMYSSGNLHALPCPGHVRC